MRLDHLLSKETSELEESSVTFLGQNKVYGVSLFNLEGTLAQRGGIAQLGEHLLCKQGVSGSSPLISTSKGDPTKAQRSGFCGERTSSEVSLFRISKQRPRSSRGRGPIAQLVRAHD